jgi:hypothetical protein
MATAFPGTVSMMVGLPPEALAIARQTLAMTDARSSTRASQP